MLRLSNSGLLIQKVRKPKEGCKETIVTTYLYKAAEAPLPEEPEDFLRRDANNTECRFIAEDVKQVPYIPTTIYQVKSS